MVNIDYRAKKIILVTLLVIGVLMLATGGIMLPGHGSSETAAASAPVESGDFQTTRPEFTAPVYCPNNFPSCCLNGYESASLEPAVPSCCVNSYEITVPEPAVPRCCGG